MTAKEIMLANNINPEEFIERNLDTLNRESHRDYFYGIIALTKAHPDLYEACEEVSLCTNY